MVERHMEKGIFPLEDGKRGQDRTVSWAAGSC